MIPKIQFNVAPPRWLSLFASACLALTISVPAYAIEIDVGSTELDGALDVTENTSLQLPLDGVLNFTTITVRGGATLSFIKNEANTPVTVLASGDVVIEADGIIDVSAPGVAGGPGGFNGGGKSSGGGAVPAGDGYGPGGGRVPEGNGSFGTRSNHADNGPVYGNAMLLPLIGGSGGAGRSDQNGGGGGGAILIASNTHIRIAGTVKAQGGGNRYYYNPGSGGGVRIVAPLVDGGGTIDARDGSASIHNGRIRIDTLDRPAALALTLQGAFTYSAFMVPTLPDMPTLTITSIGDFVVEPHASGAPVVMLFPLGTDPNQEVMLSGTNLPAEVPVKIMLTPESGSRTEFTGTMIDGAASIPVNFPVNLVTDVIAVIDPSNPAVGE